MSHQQNLTTVKEIYDAVARGDVDAILDHVTDDVNWAADAAGSTAPWYGQRAGKDGVASFFRDLADNIEISEFTPHSFAVGEDDIHLLVDWTFRSTATGREGSMTMHHYWRLRDGKVECAELAADDLWRYNRAPQPVRQRLLERELRDRLFCCACRRSHVFGYRSEVARACRAPARRHRASERTGHPAGPGCRSPGSPALVAAP